MKKISAALTCFAIMLSFVSCGNDIGFRETQNKTIVSNDGTEYTFVGNEGSVCCLGEQEFVGHVAGEKKSFVLLDDVVKTGMYSVNGGQDVLVRLFPDNEFTAIYVKSDLLKKEVAFGNCTRFAFIEFSAWDNAEAILSVEGIAECEQFLLDIKSGQKAEEAGLYDLVRQPDGMLKNCYVYGYVCGIVQDNLNIVIPLKVTSFDDKAYSIVIDDVEYVLAEEWVNRLIAD